VIYIFQRSILVMQSSRLPQVQWLLNIHLLVGFHGYMLSSLRISFTPTKL
jgi:hypothetical protein